MLLRPPTLHPMDRKFYKQIWMLFCPSKIRIAMPKFLKHFVPTRSSLYNEQIANDPLCRRCYQVVEDVNHVL